MGTLNIMEMFVPVGTLHIIEMFVLIPALTLPFASPPGRTVLHGVGMACVLGVSSASCLAIPGFTNHREINPSPFRSRALLSTIDYAAIKVRNESALSRLIREDERFFLCDMTFDLCVFDFCFFSHSPLKRSLASPLVRCHPSSICVPDFPSYTLM